MDMPTVEAYASMNLRRRIEQIAAELRKLADDVSVAGGYLDRVGEPGVSSYAYVAADVQNSVVGRLPNLSLDNLTMLAAEADVARARGE